MAAGQQRPLSPAECVGEMGQERWEAGGSGCSAGAASRQRWGALAAGVGPCRLRGKGGRGGWIVPGERARRARRDTAVDAALPARCTRPREPVDSGGQVAGSPLSQHGRRCTETGGSMISYVRFRSQPHLCCLPMAVPDNTPHKGLRSFRGQRCRQPPAAAAPRAKCAKSRADARGAGFLWPRHDSEPLRHG